jgi:hypothetical protein
MAWKCFCYGRLWIDRINKMNRIVFVGGGWLRGVYTERSECACRDGRSCYAGYFVSLD